MTRWENYLLSDLTAIVSTLCDIVLACWLFLSALYWKFLIFFFRPSYGGLSAESQFRSESFTSSSSANLLIFNGIFISYRFEEGGISLWLWWWRSLSSLLSSVKLLCSLTKSSHTQLPRDDTKKRTKQVKSILKLFPQFRYSKEKFHIPHTPTLFHIKVMERNSYWFFVVTFWLLFFHVAAADLSLLSYYVSTRHSHLKPLHLLSNLDIKMDRLRKSVRCVVVVLVECDKGKIMYNPQLIAHSLIFTRSSRMIADE